MKNILLKLSPAKIIAILALVLVVVGFASIARAGSIFSWLRVEDKVAAHIAEKVSTPEEGDEILGAVSSADSLPPLVCTADACTHTTVVSFKDATTTIISIPSPFLQATSTAGDIVIFTDDGGRKYTSATATIDLARINITGAATTSFALACAAHSGPTRTTAFPTGIVTTTAFAVPTSSLGLIENNLTAANGGLVDGGTTSKIALTPAAPYLLCNVQESVAGGITNANNTFDGKVTVRFNKAR